jgi:hypothetical protein
MSQTGSSQITLSRTASSQTTSARAFAMTSVVGLIVAVVATVIGHIGLGPGFNPLALTLSDYALSDRGGAIEVAMVALALGSLALLAGLAAARAPVRGLPTLLMLIWGGGLLVAAIIPTDPPGAASMSTAAYIHRYASVAGFISLPIAAAILASRFGVTNPWARLSSLLRGLALVCASGIALLWYVAFPGGRVLMGLVERGLVAVEIVILLALSIGLLRVGTHARIRAGECSVHGGRSRSGHSVA